VIGLDHVVLHIAANTVLRAEQGCEVYFRVLEKDIGCVTKIGQDRSLIAHKPDALAGKSGDAVLEKDLDPWSNSFACH
jgi:hypothetical protein